MSSYLCVCVKILIILKERYATFDSGIGAAIEKGQVTLEQLEVRKIACTI